MRHFFSAHYTLSQKRLVIQKYIYLKAHHSFNKLKTVTFYSLYISDTFTTAKPPEQHMIKVKIRDVGEGGGGGRGGVTHLSGAFSREYPKLSQSLDS